MTSQLHHHNQVTILQNLFQYTMTLMMTSYGGPDQDTNETKGTENDGAGPAKRMKKSEDGDISQDLESKNNELKAALAMADAEGLEEEEEGTSTEEQQQVKSKGGRKASPAKSREARLQQNRKAARDSRKRKKEMIEELQRSLIFFSRSNAALKQQNDYLTRRLIEAQTTIQALQKHSPSQGSQQAVAPAPQATTPPVMAPAPEAVYQAAPTAVFVPSNEGPAPSPANFISAFTPAMQPGSTMQAMSNFQQAAAAAMQAAAQGMHQQAAQQIAHLAEQGASPTTDKNGDTNDQTPPQDSNNLTWL
jgi:hypothetical protein